MLMEELLSNIGLFFTSAVSWMSSVLATVSTNATLVVMVIAIPVAGVAIGYLKRLISL